MNKNRMTDVSRAHACPAARLKPLLGLGGDESEMFLNRMGSWAPGARSTFLQSVRSIFSNAAYCLTCQVAFARARNNS